MGNPEGAVLLVSVYIQLSVSLALPWVVCLGEFSAVQGTYAVSQLGGVFRREFGGTEVVYYTHATIPQLPG